MGQDNERDRADDDDSGTASGGGRLWILGAIVAGAAVLAGFYGMDTYSAGTNAAIQTSSDNAKDFETVFRDLLKQRSLVMSMAADVLLQDTTTMEAFARQDRPTLVARMEPFFAAAQEAPQRRAAQFLAAAGHDVTRRGPGRGRELFARGQDPHRAAA